LMREEPTFKGGLVSAGEGDEEGNACFLFDCIEEPLRQHCTPVAMGGCSLVKMKPSEYSLYELFRKQPALASISLVAGSLLLSLTMILSALAMGSLRGQRSRLPKAVLLQIQVVTLFPFILALWNFIELASPLVGGIAEGFVSMWEAACLIAFALLAIELAGGQDSLTKNLFKNLGRRQWIAPCGPKTKFHGCNWNFWLLCISQFVIVGTCIDFYQGFGALDTISLPGSQSGILNLYKIVSLTFAAYGLLRIARFSSYFAPPSAKIYRKLVLVKSMITVSVLQSILVDVIVQCSSSPSEGESSMYKSLVGSLLFLVEAPFMQLAINKEFQVSEVSEAISTATFGPLEANLAPKSGEDAVIYSAPSPVFVRRPSVPEIVQPPKSSAEGEEKWFSDQHL